MERIIYPLLYFKMANDAVLGILIGTDYQVVDKDLKSVKATLSEHLARQYKKFDDYPYMDIEQVKVRSFKVKVRPTYREKTGAYPMSQSVEVPVFAVYGENPNNYFECYLPLMNESFYYYNAKELPTLVGHFATNYFNRLAPDDIYRFMMLQNPQLDSVALKVNYNRDFDWEGNNYEKSYPNLERLAQQYPYSRAFKRQMSAFPEAAWELEHKVSEVIEKVINVRSNILVVGANSVGKSSVLRQAIKKISTRSRKEKLDFTFWQIRPQRITASAKYLGEWQEMVEKLVEDLEAANGILWVVDFVQLLKIGGEGPEDSVASFMISFLQQGKLQLMGELTPTELESVRRLLPGFVENFQIVKIDELPENKIFSILNKFADYSQQNLKVKIEDRALQLSYRLLLRYYPYESFPGKAVKFLGQCINNAQVKKVDTIDKNLVIENFVEQTGLPELFLRDDLMLEQEELKSFFESRIMGQTKAVEQLTGIVKIFKAGLNNPYKPISTMVFAGPTGVGKTASAKALADYFFGKGQKRSPLIRIDMSEFQHPSQIARFIGTGNQVGKLVQEIRERPFSVLLLDEVEKAAPTIFDALLTVLDEGMMVDAYGRITNFRNTIIIMTTNLGASNQQSLGFNTKIDEESAFLAAIGNYFRPEFVNRIDTIVSFNALSQKDIRAITIKELNDLKKREGIVKKHLTLTFTDALVEHISTIGFDARYGARPLQRAVEQHLVAPLSKWLLEKNHLENVTIELDYQEKLRFRVQ
jgi:ATP-dependent Clp protease ATP-binding subunit ClpC